MPNDPAVSAIPWGLEIVGVPSLAVFRVIIIMERTSKFGPTAGRVFSSGLALGADAPLAFVGDAGP